MNIKCAVPGCNEPVIGQCMGYKAQCGRFYCHTHSSGNLCDACAAEKLRDELQEKMYIEYSNKVNEIGGVPKLGYVIAYIYLVCSILCLPLALVMFLINEPGRQQEAVIILVFSVILIPLLLLVVRKYKRAQILVDKYDQNHRGFKEFYLDVKRNRSRNALRILGGAAALIVITGVASNYSRDARIERDIRHIKDRLGIYQ